MLFAEADGVNYSTIRDVLDDFCAVSGQTVSDSKSRVYFSPNVDRDTTKSLCDILGFASTPTLGKYLGFPLKHPGSSSQEYNFILDKIKQKLLGWKASMLSLAGRSMLIQASSAAIPSYIMQCVQLPSKILEGLDRVNHNFLWGSTDTAKKIHWNGWDKVTKVKGALVCNQLRGGTPPSWQKLNWRFRTEEAAPWNQVLKMKYHSQRRVAANPNILKCAIVVMLCVIVVIQSVQW